MDLMFDKIETSILKSMMHGMMTKRIIWRITFMRECVRGWLKRRSVIRKEKDNGLRNASWKEKLKLKCSKTALIYFSHPHAPGPSDSDVLLSRPVHFLLLL